MLTIPLSSNASQIISVILDGQNTTLTIYNRGGSTYVDANVNGSALIYGVLAHDAVPLIWCDYAGFAGNLLFLDLQGSEDPVYTGFATRYILVYLTSTEYERYKKL